MAESEKDDAMLAEAENALKNVAAELNKLEIDSLLSGEEAGIKSATICDNIALYSHNCITDAPDKTECSSAAYPRHNS